MESQVCLVMIALMLQFDQRYFESTFDNSGIRFAQKVLQNHSVSIDHPIQQHHLVPRITLFIPNFTRFSHIGVVLDTIQVLIKYATHLMDQWRENGFESKRLINYYTELSADVLILACTLLQYLQLMVRNIDIRMDNGI
ncbi:hypothetical protein MAM1_0075c04329 [Mucor ambiguus]|uniref:Uncharacterized protein n=1 Tax=Mucor ambiguus TaxID=91626 RepID=A0A0C9MC23_9FUNG|nr:hypothetical protein MAM1_0075c04329 [Mucor ambiguus]